MSQDATFILFGLRGVKVRRIDRAGVADLPGEVEGAGRRLVPC